MPQARLQPIDPAQDDALEALRDGNCFLPFPCLPDLSVAIQLARIELRAILEVLIPRVTRFELAGPVLRARSSFLNAIKELPLRAC